MLENVNEARANAEVIEAHTRLMKVALGLEDSRSYWSNIANANRTSDLVTIAFEGRWFGAKSIERVRMLLAHLSFRYDTFPEAIKVLQKWRTIDLNSMKLVCHLHLQLTDPLYRQFTGVFLPERREGHELTIDREAVVRWIEQTYPERWQRPTKVKFASNLLSICLEVGLLQSRRDPRTLVYPKVTALGLGYLLYLLRGVQFQGTLSNNPYLASLGLTGTFLDQQIKSVPGIHLRRMGDLVEFEWAAPNLTVWAEDVL